MAEAEERVIMQILALREMPKTASHLKFHNEVQDDLIVKDVKLKNCKFTWLGLRDAQFKDSSITQSIFEDCYLRKASFEDVRLTGSTFRNCNLEKATFQGCDLRYCTFENTRLKREEIKACLPPEPNLRRDLARNLKSNFDALGDKESRDFFINIEIQAYEEETLAIFQRATEYYRQRYNYVDQVKAGLRYLLSKTSGLIWGYGYRLSRLLISFIVLTVVLGAITYFGNINFVVGEGLEVRPLGFWESLYHALGECLGVATTGFMPTVWFGRLLQLWERFLGTLFLALLAAAAYRRITR